ncbi:MAG: hypothetical protein EOP04_25590 [Proteobacteria bacterium]|nr:MAG: hypothetical protein EOP04_25590 [Pseudomonadota bacterium]
MDLSLNLIKEQAPGCRKALDEVRMAQENEIRNQLKRLAEFVSVPTSAGDSGITVTSVQKAPQVHKPRLGLDCSRKGRFVLSDFDIC